MSMTEKITGAEAMLRALITEKVDTVFARNKASCW